MSGESAGFFWFLGLPGRREAAALPRLAGQRARGPARQQPPRGLRSFTAHRNVGVSRRGCAAGN